MATNENEIGVKAKFVIDEFLANQKRYDATLGQANASTQAFYQTQIMLQAKAAQQAKASADQIVAAINKRDAAEKKSTDNIKAQAVAQSNSVKDMVSKYTQTAAALTVIVGGIIIGYKRLEEAAKRLGDEESIAGFKALEEATTNLGDSFAAMVLEAIPIGDALKFIAEGIKSLAQVATIAAVSYTYLFNLIANIAKYEEYEVLKMITSGTLAETLAQAHRQAKAAADAVVIASVQAPAKVKATAQAPDDAKAEEKRLSDLAAAEEKRLKAIADYSQKYNDLTIKTGESILAAEEDFQAKSMMAWTDYIENISSIVAAGIAKRAELLSTYQDAIQGAERDYQRGTEDAAYNHGKRLADIERNYQDTIRQINKDYGEESLDAARNLDAIGFVRAKQKRDSALSDAERSRDRANSDENENYSRQLYELQRALEDKKREAEQAYQRGLDDQRRAEDEATQAAKDAYNKQLSDAQNAFNAKIAAINAAYANEDAAAQAHYLNQETMYAAHLAAMQAMMSRYNVAGTGYTGGGGPRGRAEGGLDFVSTPTQFIAGEAGPEMVYTVPLNRSVPMPQMQYVNHTGDFTHQIDSTIRSSVAGIDGRITAAITKVLREVLG